MPNINEVLTSYLQYIGARYVPKFFLNPDDQSNDWKAGTFYEALTIVTYNNDSYTSKIVVPDNIGDPASNPTYWACTTKYTAALMALQTTVQNLEDEVNDIDTALSGLFGTPQMYGAIGDGVNDDTDAIQTAINNHKSVFIPSGNYKITHTIVIPSKHEVTGCGKTSVLKWFGANSPILMGETNSFAIHIYNLSITGNNSGTGIYIKTTNIDPDIRTYDDYSIFAKLFLNALDTGIYIGNDCRCVTISDVSGLGFASNGIVMEDCSDNIIINTTISAATKAGLKLYNNGGGNLINNFKAFGCGDAASEPYGIILDGYSNMFTNISNVQNDRNGMLVNCTNSLIDMVCDWNSYEHNGQYCDVVFGTGKFNNVSIQFNSGWDNTFTKAILSFLNPNLQNVIDINGQTFTVGSFSGATQLVLNDSNIGSNRIRINGEEVKLYEVTPAISVSVDANVTIASLKQIEKEGYYSIDSTSSSATARINYSLPSELNGKDIYAKVVYRILDNSSNDCKLSVSTIGLDNDYSQTGDIYTGQCKSLSLSGTVDSSNAIIQFDVRNIGAANTWTANIEILDVYISTDEPIPETIPTLKQCGIDVKKLQQKMAELYYTDKQSSDGSFTGALTGDGIYRVVIEDSTSLGYAIVIIKLDYGVGVDIDNIANNTITVTANAYGSINCANTTGDCTARITKLK